MSEEVVDDSNDLLDALHHQIVTENEEHHDLVEDDDLLLMLADNNDETPGVSSTTHGALHGDSGMQDFDEIAQVANSILQDAIRDENPHLLTPTTITAGEQEEEEPSSPQQQVLFPNSPQIGRYTSTDDTNSSAKKSQRQIDREIREKAEKIRRENLEAERLFLKEQRKQQKKGGAETKEKMPKKTPQAVVKDVGKGKALSKAYITSSDDSSSDDDTADAEQKAMPVRGVIDGNPPPTAKASSSSSSSDDDMPLAAKKPTKPPATGPKRRPPGSSTRRRVVPSTTTRRRTNTPKRPPTSSSDSDSELKLAKSKRKIKTEKERSVVKTPTMTDSEEAKSDSDSEPLGRLTLKESKSRSKTRTPSVDGKKVEKDATSVQSEPKYTALLAEMRDCQVGLIRLTQFEIDEWAPKPKCKDKKAVKEKTPPTKEPKKRQQKGKKKEKSPAVVEMRNKSEEKMELDNEPIPAGPVAEPIEIDAAVTTVTAATVEQPKSEVDEKAEVMEEEQKSDDIKTTTTEEQKESETPTNDTDIPAEKAAEPLDRPPSRPESRSSTVVSRGSRERSSTSSPMPQTSSRKRSATKRAPSKEPTTSEKEPLEDNNKCFGCGKTLEANSNKDDFTIYCSDVCIDAQVELAKQALGSGAGDVHVVVRDARAGGRVLGAPRAPLLSALGTFLRRNPAYSPLLPQQQAATTPTTPASSAKTKEKQRKGEQKSGVEKTEADSSTDSAAIADSVRINVRKAIKDSLMARYRDAADLLVTPSDVRDIAVSVEEQLQRQSKRQKSNANYKRWFKAFLTCVKDKGNLGFFRRVLTGELSAAKLVTLKCDELSSEEYARAPEGLETAAAAPPTAQTPSAGGGNKPFRIPKVGTTPSDDVLQPRTPLQQQQLASTGAKQKMSAAHQPSASKPSSASSDVLGAVLGGLADTTAEHKSHLFSLNCQICTQKNQDEAERVRKQKERFKELIEERERERQLKQQQHRSDSPTEESVSKGQWGQRRGAPAAPTGAKTTAEEPARKTAARPSATIDKDSWTTKRIDPIRDKEKRELNKRRQIQDVAPDSSSGGGAKLTAGDDDYGLDAEYEEFFDAHQQQQPRAGAGLLGNRPQDARGMIAAPTVADPGPTDPRRQRGVTPPMDGVADDDWADVSAQVDPIADGRCDLDVDDYDYGDFNDDLYDDDFAALGAEAGGGRILAADGSDNYEYPPQEEEYPPRWDVADMPPHRGQYPDYGMDGGYGIGGGYHPLLDTNPHIEEEPYELLNRPDYDYRRWPPEDEGELLTHRQQPALGYDTMAGMGIEARVVQPLEEDYYYNDAYDYGNGANEGEEDYDEIDGEPLDDEPPVDQDQVDTTQSVGYNRTPPQSIESNENEEVAVTSAKPRTPSPPPPEEETAVVEEEQEDTSKTPNPWSTKEDALVWVGEVMMERYFDFRTSLTAVSGAYCFRLKYELPECLEIVGRIPPSVVWTYIGQVQKTEGKDVCAFLLDRPADQKHRKNYDGLYENMMRKNRFCVIGKLKEGSRAIKDGYIFPLPSSAEVPEELVPFEGQGLPASRHDLLMCIIVRNRLKDDVDYAKFTTKCLTLRADAVDEAYSPTAAAGIERTLTHSPTMIPVSESQSRIDQQNANLPTSQLPPSNAVTELIVKIHQTEESDAVAAMVQKFLRTNVIDEREQTLILEALSVKVQQIKRRPSAPSDPRTPVGVPPPVVANAPLEEGELPDDDETTSATTTTGNTEQPPPQQQQQHAAMPPLTPEMYMMLLQQQQQPMMMMPPPVVLLPPPPPPPLPPPPATTASAAVANRVEDDMDLSGGEEEPTKKTQQPHHMNLYSEDWPSSVEEEDCPFPASSDSGPKPAKRPRLGYMGRNEAPPAWEEPQQQWSAFEETPPQHSQWHRNEEQQQWQDDLEWNYEAGPGPSQNKPRSLFDSTPVFAPAEPPGPPDLFRLSDEEDESKLPMQFGRPSRKTPTPPLHHQQQFHARGAFRGRGGGRPRGGARGRGGPRHASSMDEWRRERQEHQFDPSVAPNRGRGALLNIPPTFGAPRGHFYGGPRF